jgi:hypothetical protein
LSSQVIKQSQSEYTAHAKCNESFAFALDTSIILEAISLIRISGSTVSIQAEDEDYTTPIRSVNASNINSSYIKTADTGNTGMANCSAKSFRLPTSDEWELAAP